MTGRLSEQDPDAALTLDVSDSSTLGLSYAGQLGSGLSDHSARATFNVRF